MKFAGTKESSAELKGEVDTVGEFGQLEEWPRVRVFFFFPPTHLFSFECAGEEAKEMVVYHLGTWSYETTAWGKISSPPCFLQ